MRGGGRSGSRFWRLDVVNFERIPTDIKTRLDYDTGGKWKPLISRLSNNFQRPTIFRRFQLDSPRDRSGFDFGFGLRLGSGSPLDYGYGKKLSVDIYRISSDGVLVLCGRYHRLGLERVG